MRSSCAGTRASAAPIRLDPPTPVKGVRVQEGVAPPPLLPQTRGSASPAAAHAGRPSAHTHTPPPCGIDGNRGWRTGSPRRTAASP